MNSSHQFRPDGHKVIKVLSNLPIFKSLAPAVKHYIFDRVQVESYSALDKVPMEDPLTKFDFLYVMSGIVEISLADEIDATN